MINKSSLIAIAATLVSAVSMATTPTGKNFNDTGDILARSTQHTNIEYDIMVQRATQAAIYYMPAVAQIDFICSGQLILATGLYSSQYLFSDSLGVSPRL
jgi:hypothetical protein